MRTQTPGGAIRRSVTRRLLPGALVFALAFGLVPAAAHAAFPGRNGPLVIGGSSFDRDTETDVFFIGSIRPDGRPAHVGLPSCSSFEDEDCPSVSDAVLSPDGRRLAFRRGDGIAVADPDGGGLRELAGLPPGAGAPAWSPDGTEIVFAAAAAAAAAAPGAGDSDLFVAPVEGGAVRRLTDTPGVSEGRPTWGTRPAAEGGLIAYERDRRIWTVRPDGERVRRLTGREGSDPSFSPRASRIAFVRRSQVYTVGARGGGLDRVTNRGGWSPSWSPDGRRIAFFRFDRRPGIYRMGPRGGALTRVKRLVEDSACGCFYEDSLDWGPRR